MISSADATTPAPISKEALLTHLIEFVNKRSGLNREDYMCMPGDADGERAYRSDLREIRQQGREARKLIEFVRRTDAITADQLLCHGYGSRLQYDRDALRWDFTPYQCGALEYRRAVSGMLLHLVWHYYHAVLGYKSDAEKVAAAIHDLGGRIAYHWVRR